MSVLEQRIESAYMAKTGVQRRPTCVQLERMVELAKVLARRDPLDGSSVHWTWPQLAEAIGFPVMGMSKREIKVRWGVQLERTMRYLMAAGYVTGWEISYETGSREPNGILVSLPAGVAQLVQAARYRPRGEHSAPHTSVRKRGRGGAFFSPQSVGPSAAGSSPPHPLKGRYPEKGRRGAARAERAQPEASTRDRARRSTEVRAALQKRRRAHGDELGGAIVAALPWIAAVPVDIVAREAMRIELELDPQLGDEQLRRPVRGRLSARRARRLATLALSPLWQHRLAVAGRQLDRYANMGAGEAGAGAAIVIDLVRGDWQEWLATPPRSLGAIAVCARRQAREWRRHERARQAAHHG